MKKNEDIESNNNNINSIDNNHECHYLLTYTIHFTNNKLAHKLRLLNLPILQKKIIIKIVVLCHPWGRNNKHFIHHLVIFPTVTIVHILPSLVLVNVGQSSRNRNR